MKAMKFGLLASAGVIFLGSTAHAQDGAASAQASSPSAQSASVNEDIIVTARRRNELLSDVPLTVNAVSSDMIEKLNIERFEDIQAIVPGLTLTNSETGYSAAATIRGAAFQTESSTSPTVEFYINEALVQSTFLFQSMFDVGQIEVLRGPQGTLRGRAAPSGSITVTTRRPDLDAFGGYVDGSVTTTGGAGINGALNVPIIAGKVALRIAGIADENDADEVRSINSDVRPFARTKGYRASLRIEPTDTVSANVMYQKIIRDSATFSQVESLSIVDPDQDDSAVPIRAKDRRSIYAFPGELHNKQQILTGQLDWLVGGQRLSYVGSWSKMDTHNNIWESATDLAMVYPTLDSRQPAYVQGEQDTHEFRLSSDERLFGVLDYTAGVFKTTLRSPTSLKQVSVLDINVPMLGVIQSVGLTDIQRRSIKNETSFFGNLTLHLGENTEVSGGLRHIKFKTFDYLAITPSSADASTIVVQNDRYKYSPTIYNASISHRFSDDLMVYGNTGSSWRPSAYLIGVFTNPLSPRLKEFTQLTDEKSKSYEIGFKSSFFDKKVRLNVAAFQQDFDGYIYRGNLVNYVDLNYTFPDVVDPDNPPAPIVTPVANVFNFGANLDARVRGIEADLFVQASQKFSLGANFSYAKGKIKNDFIPCNDLDGNGVADSNSVVPTPGQISAGAGGESVARCRVNGRMAFSPDWTLTLQSEYAAPLSGATDAFIRGVFSYYPKHEGDSTNPYDSVKSYGLLNLYAGVRSKDSAWELSFFARNLLNEGQVVSRGSRELSTSIIEVDAMTQEPTGARSVGTGYVAARYTAPREFGFNLRYAFGSR